MMCPFPSLRCYPLTVFRCDHHAWNPPLTGPSTRDVAGHRPESGHTIDSGHLTVLPCNYLCCAGARTPPAPARTPRGRHYLLVPQYNRPRHFLATGRARPLNGSDHLAALSYLAGSYVISRACLTLSLSVRGEHYTQLPPNVYPSDHRFTTTPCQDVEPWMLDTTAWPCFSAYVTFLFGQAGAGAWRKRCRIAAVRPSRLGSPRLRSLGRSEVVCRGCPARRPGNR